MNEPFPLADEGVALLLAAALYEGPLMYVGSGFPYTDVGCAAVFDVEAGACAGAAALSALPEAAASAPVSSFTFNALSNASASSPPLDCSSNPDCRKRITPLRSSTM